MTHSPTLTASESPKSTALISSASIWSTAKSVALSNPITVASKIRLSSNWTLISSTGFWDLSSKITWWLVTIYAFSSSTITPEPRDLLSYSSGISLPQYL